MSSHSFQPLNPSTPRHYSVLEKPTFSKTPFDQAYAAIENRTKKAARAAFKASKETLETTAIKNFLKTKGWQIYSGNQLKLAEGLHKAVDDAKKPKTWLGKAIYSLLHLFGAAPSTPLEQLIKKVRALVASDPKFMGTKISASQRGSLVPLLPKEEREARTIGEVAERILKGLQKLKSSGYAKDALRRRVSKEFPSNPSIDRLRKRNLRRLKP